MVFDLWRGAGPGGGVGLNSPRPYNRRPTGRRCARWLVSWRSDKMGPSTCNLLALFILLASAPLPNSGVPNFSDLKIETRRFDQSSSSTEALYLKGARQRREYAHDKPFNSSLVKPSFLSFKMSSTTRPASSALPALMSSRMMLLRTKS